MPLFPKGHGSSEPLLFRPKADLPTEIAVQRSRNDRASVPSRSVRLRDHQEVHASSTEADAVATRLVRRPTHVIEFHSPLSVDYEATRARIRAVAEDVAAIMRSIYNANARTSGLDWTLGETSAHLCTTMRLYIDCLEGRIVPESPLVADVPSFVQQQNEARLQTFAERRPALLADLLLGEVDALLAILERRSLDDAVPFPAGYQIDAAVQSSIALAELLIHGLDLARSTGKAWDISAEDAVLTITGTIALMPVAANRERAKRVRGTVHTRLRGDGC